MPKIRIGKIKFWSQELQQWNYNESKVTLKILHSRRIEQGHPNINSDVLKQNRRRLADKLFAQEI